MNPVLICSVRVLILLLLMGLAGVCQILQRRRRRLHVWNGAQFEEAPESPPISPRDENAPPSYTNRLSDEEMRLSLATPASVFDVLLPSGAQPPPYSELAAHKASNEANDHVDSYDPQTILDTTRNHLDTAASARSAQEQALSAAVTLSLATQAGTSMLLPGWLMRLTTLVYQRACERYNVIAVAVDKRFHVSINGVIADFLIEHNIPKASWSTTRRASGESEGSGSLEYSDKMAFRVVVFREGVVVLADGVSDSFWDWRGEWERVGSRVIRFRPCV